MSMTFAFWKRKKQKQSHQCLTVSEIIYGFFHAIDKTGIYKINIVLTFYPTETRGHAWVTRNGRKFLLANHSIIMSKLSMIGENEKYRYYVKENNLNRMFAYEKLRKSCL